MISQCIRKGGFMHEDATCNDLQEIITHAINEIKQEQGEKFSPAKINLAELERRTGISRSRLRRLKENNFIVTPHGRTGQKATSTVLTGYSGIIDGLLRKGVTNSSVCFERLQEAGYTGGLTTVKTYIADHRDLVPPKRQLVAPQGNRGRRYQTSPGVSYQMDRGFVQVDTNTDASYKVACFAMICHHCGERYIEFFPNARQENLFIGMIHAFTYMGIPRYILTDNMKSVVIRRDPEGHPIWQKDYKVFMETIGFQTKLCKPRHPFTKTVCGIQIHLMLLFISHFCGFFRVIILHSSALYSLFTLFYQPLPYYCTSLSISSYFLLFSLLVKTLQLIFTW